MRRAIIQRPVFRFGRRHTIWFQNLRVQSTAENLTHIGSLPKQKSGTKAGRSRRGNREEGQNPVAGLPFWTVSHDMVSEPLCTKYSGLLYETDKSDFQASDRKFIELPADKIKGIQNI